MDEINLDVGRKYILIRNKCKIYLDKYMFLW